MYLYVYPLATTPTTSSRQKTYPHTLPPLTLKCNFAKKLLILAKKKSSNVKYNRLVSVEGQEEQLQVEDKEEKNPQVPIYPVIIPWGM